MADYVDMQPTQTTGPNPVQGAVAVMFAAGVGYALGILFAPRSGRETRMLIGKKAQQAKDRANQKMERTKEKLRSLVDTASRRAKEVQRQAQAELDEQVRQNARRR